MSTMTTTITDVKVTTGIAGQVQASVTTTVAGIDDDGTSWTDDGSPTTFVGSVYGGPVVMLFGDHGQTFVRHPGRFGDFGKSPEGWVRRFFA